MCYCAPFQHRFDGSVTVAGFQVYGANGVRQKHDIKTIRQCIIHRVKDAIVRGEATDDNSLDTFCV